MESAKRVEQPSPWLRCEFPKPAAERVVEYTGDFLEAVWFVPLRNTLCVLLGTKEWACPGPEAILSILAQICPSGSANFCEHPLPHLPNLPPIPRAFQRGRDLTLKELKKATWVMEERKHALQVDYFRICQRAGGRFLSLEDAYRLGGHLSTLSRVSISLSTYLFFLSQRYKNSEVGPFRLFLLDGEDINAFLRDRAVVLLKSFAMLIRYGETFDSPLWFCGEMDPYHFSFSINYIYVICKEAQRMGDNGVTLHLLQKALSVVAQCPLPSLYVKDYMKLIWSIIQNEITLEEYSKVKKILCDFITNLPYRCIREETYLHFFRAMDESLETEIRAEDSVPSCFFWDILTHMVQRGLQIDETQFTRMTWKDRTLNLFGRNSERFCSMFEGRPGQLVIEALYRRQQIDRIRAFFLATYSFLSEDRTFSIDASDDIEVLYNKLKNEVVPHFLAARKRKGQSASKILKELLNGVGIFHSCEAPKEMEKFKRLIINRLSRSVFCQYSANSSEKVVGEAQNLLSLLKKGASGSSFACTVVNWEKCMRAHSLREEDRAAIRRHFPMRLNLEAAHEVNCPFNSTIFEERSCAFVTYRPECHAGIELDEREAVDFFPSRPYITHPGMAPEWFSP